jgi:hypothetical protein
MPDRPLLVFVFLSAGCYCCLAQQHSDDKKLLERVMANPNMSLVNPMDGKKFNTAGFSSAKKATGPSTFLYDQKFSSQKYQNVRSFLGVKNPWFGKVVYESNKASLWSKTLVKNADKKVDVESVKTRKFHLADKKAAKREDPVRGSTYLERGGAQGSLDRVSEQIGKNLTIDQVRQILNKNH